MGGNTYQVNWCMSRGCTNTQDWKTKKKRKNKPKNTLTNSNPTKTPTSTWLERKQPVSRKIRAQGEKSQPAWGKGQPVRKKLSTKMGKSNVQGGRKKKFKP